VHQCALHSIVHHIMRDYALLGAADRLR
jgi:hypothetical protein